MEILKLMAENMGGDVSWEMLYSEVKPYAAVCRINRKFFLLIKRDEITRSFPMGDVDLDLVKCSTIKQVIEFLEEPPVKPSVVNPTIVFERGGVLENWEIPEGNA